MIIAHYAHRLPADYDIKIIRDRAGRRGHLFDAIPELYFKAFLLRERGRFGAIQNAAEIACNRVAAKEPAWSRPPCASMRKTDRY
jgi:hypothetical protein